MKPQPISDAFPYEMRRVPVHDSEMAYVDVGSGKPIVFLHGNPSSSYIWRNIIPYVQGQGRCLAPDLIGMGQSGRSPRYAYRFADHVAYLDAWFDAVGVGSDVILVLQDWGAALGFWRACRMPERIAGIVYMEAMVRPRLWSDMPPERVAVFKRLRGPEGERMVIEENFFIETMLFEKGVIRRLTDTEKAIYRAPYLDPIARVPTLVWPREIAFEGEPADNFAIIQKYSDWLCTSSDVPKLFVNATHGHGLAGAAREFCRNFPNQREITVTAGHFCQEDAPHDIGEALARFVADVRG